MQSSLVESARARANGHWQMAERLGPRHCPCLRDLLERPPLLLNSRAPDEVGISGTIVTLILPLLV